MTQHLFATREDADVVFEQVYKACKDYNTRANDREKIISFECLNGMTAIDVSAIICIGVDDALEEKAKAALLEWHKGIKEIRAAGKLDD